MALERFPQLGRLWCERTYAAANAPLVDAVRDLCVRGVLDVPDVALAVRRLVSVTMSIPQLAKTFDPGYGPADAELRACVAGGVAAAAAGRARAAAAGAAAPAPRRARAPRTAATATTAPTPPPAGARAPPRSPPAPRSSPAPARAGRRPSSRSPRASTPSAPSTSR
ncbi:TetR/AcrR family transcriptional regulator C-terminal domain-containing protein [Streptomyces sp. NPDC051183]|uniref:TetR/AcrR family transcriptional regulator C-terminal domain-containing protein n=1 Tax=Streptomyces sp. NPDC051183 TaxID=3155165 RepID=UPI003445005A